MLTNNGPPVAAKRLGPTVCGVAQFNGTFEEAVALLLAEVNGSGTEYEEQDSSEEKVANFTDKIPPEDQVCMWQSSEARPRLFSFGVCAQCQQEDDEHEIVEGGNECDPDIHGERKICECKCIQAMGL